VSTTGTGSHPPGERERPVLGLELRQGVFALGAVDIEHEEPTVAGDQSEVGELPAAPPGGHDRRLGRCLFEAVEQPRVLAR
jgi:hypothetical protein